MRPRARRFLRMIPTTPMPKPESNSMARHPRPTLTAVLLLGLFAAQMLRPVIVQAETGFKPVATHGKHFSNPFRNLQERYRIAHLRFKHRMQESYWGYPEYFEKNDIGSATRVAFEAMKQSGHPEQCILYLSDFYPEGGSDESSLTPYGEARLERIIRRSERRGLQLGIEMTRTNRRLDESRRASLASHPALGNLVFSPEEIRLVDKPRGVDAVEAIDHYYNGQLDTARGSGGAMGGTGDSSTGGNSASLGSGLGFGGM